MRNNWIKRLGIVMIAICILSCGIGVEATQVEEKFLQKEIAQMKDIENQLQYLLQTGYLNVVNGKSNKALLQSTNSYNAQIKELGDTLSEIQGGTGLTTEQIYKVLLMKRGVDYLVFLDKNLQDYLKSKEAAEQFEYLKNQILVDSLLKQLIIYVENED